uniref:GP-PDE domain-containing protein n=2 Tax=Lepeophtheirus salmonis TaxID=72036 RepID=A0A0K2TTA7_LEPSM
MDTRKWKFSVRCDKLLLDGESMCITGSEPSLGKWQVQRVVPLPSPSSPSEPWEIELPISANKITYYRYCVCYFVENEDKKEPTVVVREWETDLTPRKISSKNIEYINETFGHFSRQPECNTRQSGWLTQETYVEFKLQGDAVVLWKKKHLNKTHFVKVSGIETINCNHVSSFDFEESIDVYSDQRHTNKAWPIIEVAELNADKCVPRPQSQFGVPYISGNFISIQAYVLSLPTVAFLVDFYVNDSPKLVHDILPKHVGSCYVMPDQLKSTEGKISLPIVSRGFQPIGQFNASYLVVKPLKDIQCDFAVSFATYWKSIWKGLDVGHRGSGNSFSNLKDCASIRENSIASLRNAFDHGADMVEFDVQLSKDLIPVIYHDFVLYTTVMHKKKPNEKFLVEMPLKNLTLEELHKYKIHNKHEKDSGLKEFLEDEDHEAFPTLEKALNVIREDGGFNIEVKWDIELKDGKRENNSAFEINLFADTVIKTVLANGKSRPIVFSSFNPDICTVFRKKQNQYPVLLLTVGINTKYEQYLDARTWSIDKGSYFVEMQDILGINAMAEDIQRDPTQVQLVKSKNRVLFCWTDDKNDKETVEYLKQIGVDGVIFDRMDENKIGESGRQNRFTLIDPTDNDNMDEEGREFLKEIIVRNKVSPPHTTGASTVSSSFSFSGLFNNASLEVSSPLS